MSRYKQPYSLFKRGKYFYYRTYTPEGIRTVAKSTGCTSKGAARTYCDNLFLTGGLWTSSKTFGAFAEGFYDIDGIYFRDRAGTTSPSTIRTYRSNFKNNIINYFYNIKLNEINYIVLKNYRHYLIDCDYSAATIPLIMTLLKNVIIYAYRSRIISTNPFDFLEPLRLKKRASDAYTLDEIKNIYKNIDNEFKNTIICMSLTGLRISEYIGIRPEDIKQENGIYYIDLKKQFLNNEYVPLKNKTPRIIPITEELVPLFGFKTSRRANFYHAFAPFRSSEDDAERLLRVHSLRHFFITATKSAGISDVKVEVIVGHKLEGMQNVYTNFKLMDLTDIIPWQKATLEKIKAGVENGPNHTSKDKNDSN